MGKETETSASLPSSGKGHRCAALCGRPAEQRCAGCSDVHYCGRPCQRKHWKTHRLACRAYCVDSSPLVGRRLKASRDLKAGEVILRDKPLVVGPKSFKPVCLGCYGPIKGRIQCALCGWLMCGDRDCPRAGHAAECELIRRHRPDGIVLEEFRQRDGVNVDYMQCAMVLRCLALRSADPDRWEQLLGLEAHSAERARIGMENLERAVVVRFLRQSVRLGEEEFSDEVILKVCGILYVNGFEVPGLGGMDGLQAVYPTVSLLEHDCVANAVTSIGSDAEMVVRAAVPIAKGDRIAITYTDPMWGTVNRRHHLKQAKFFWCRCQRCCDPTELGTMMSAVNCVRCMDQCRAGFLLPPPPLSDVAGLNDEEEDDWVCGSCGAVRSAASIGELIDDIGKELVHLKRGSIEACEDFLAKHQTVLHPHHFYMLEVKLAMCQMVGHIKDQTLLELPEDVVSMKETMCLDLLKIVDCIAPGMTRLRGMILYEMQAVMAARSRRLCLSNEINREELKTHALVVQKMLQEVATIFSWEPEDGEEGHLATVARKELIDVDMFLRTLF